MKFTKMQGIGNDYVYVNCFEEHVEDPAHVAQLVSERHFGIGSDGLILICPSEVADCRMRMFNEDGSEGSMCGNGIRCVGKYAYDHGIVDKPQISVETLGGIKYLDMRIANGKVKTVKVDMGIPQLTSELPEKIQVDGKKLEFTGIDVGNPHAVYYVDDVDSLEVLLAHSMPEGIANLMIPIAVYVAMFFVDWKLALLSLASIPISLIAMMTMYSVGMKKMGPYYMAGQKMNNTIIEYINGMEVVKVFNKDADSYERFRKDVSDYRDYTLAWYKAAWPWMAIYSSLLPCTIILTLPVGAWFVLSGWSTLSNLILVLCLSLSIGMPLLKSLGFLPTMPQLNYKISALEQVLDAPELQQTEDAFHGKDDTITYDHVSFAYQTTQPGPDGKPVVIEDEVLHDISFTAKAGQKTALVGESGSGKSTLAKLLIHYYDPQKGSISIGGQKLCDMSLEALNSRISYVAQDQYLFNTSLFENIRLGRLNATDEEVVEAAKKAQCMEFLEKLPQGIHSMAGDAGKMLSGGQRQRISLARAILKDAPIVVLDEATAYADPENEEKMEAAIAELVKGKTLVVIAHKLPAIMNADQICVMDHGKLVATGRHQELIQSCPEYQKLWKAAQDSAEWKVHTAKEGK